MNNPTMQRYTGFFDINNYSIPGEIVKNPSSGIIKLTLTQTLQSQEEVFAAADQNYHRLLSISGKLHTGEAITLFNCRCVANTLTALAKTIVFVADYMIWDNIFHIEDGYRVFECIIENGVWWSELSKISTPDSRTISIDARPNVKCFNWSEARIEFSTIITSNDFASYHHSEMGVLSERLKISIKPKTKKNVSYFLRVRNEILAMISFAIKDNINILQQYFYNYAEYPKLEEVPKLRNYIQYKIVINEKTYGIKGELPEEYNFKLSSLPSGKDFDNDLQKLQPIFHLYQSFFKYPDMPYEMLFLNMTQALETFHARFYVPVYSEVDYTLRERITELLLGKADNIFSPLCDADPDFIQKIIITRNYYTHYGQVKRKYLFSGNELFDAIQILKQVLEYHICKVLQVDLSETVLQNILDYMEVK